LKFEVCAWEVKMSELEQVQRNKIISLKEKIYILLKSVLMTSN